MNSKIHLTTTIRSLTLIALALLGFALLPRAQAVVPAPDGGYPNLTTAEGSHALGNLTTGVANTAVGWYSLFSDVTASFNTGVGAGTLLLNTGDSNTAIGTAALFSNGIGSSNTAVGTSTLQSNTEGGINTATGFQALFRNTTGSFNTANGANALVFNTTGVNNTANGYEALFSNTEGQNNTATGFSALFNNTNGSANTAVGRDALFDNTTGAVNTAIGFGALENNTSGSNNVAVGVSAGVNVSSASGVICIYNAGENVSNSCYIGNIWSQPGGTQAVYVNGQGKLGAQVSSQRFKEEIKPMDQASEVIYGLKPVSFRYKPEIEPSRPLGFGLIAEDVEKINPDLVTRDSNAQAASVRYDAVNAMLLNEFLKEHRKGEQQDRKIEEQGKSISEQQKQIQALMVMLKEQAMQIQKVSSRFEVDKAVPQIVSD